MRVEMSISPERAETIASEAFGFDAATGGMLDEETYFHTVRVVGMVTERAKALAWLHDVPESGHLSVTALVARGLSPVEADALRLLTRKPDQPYRGYMRTLVNARDEAGDLAREVKEADMLDNICRCLRSDDPKYRSLLHRYRQSLPLIQMAMTG